MRSELLRHRCLTCNVRITAAGVDARDKMLCGKTVHVARPAVRHMRPEEVTDGARDVARKLITEKRRSDQLPDIKVVATYPGNIFIDDAVHRTLYWLSDNFDGKMEASEPIFDDGFWHVCITWHRDDVPQHIDDDVAARIHSTLHAELSQHKLPVIIDVPKTYIIDEIVEFIRLIIDAGVVMQPVDEDGNEFSYSVKPRITNTVIPLSDGGHRVIVNLEM